MAKLDIVIGPMFAGKSSHLIKQIRLMKVLKKKYIVIKPLLDSRYSANDVVSHNMEKEPCLCLDILSNIFNQDLHDISMICIDEAQFFPDLKENVIKLVEEYNINIFIVGLDGDFNRNKFGQIIDLIPFSDSCIKITSLCQLCLDGTPGIFSKRLTESNEQNLIGSSETYMSVCRKHYL
jgi:thymidine kinase